MIKRFFEFVEKVFKLGNMFFLISINLVPTICPPLFVFDECCRTLGKNLYCATKTAKCNLTFCYQTFIVIKYKSRI